MPIASFHPLGSPEGIVHRFLPWAQVDVNRNPAILRNQCSYSVFCKQI